MKKKKNDLDIERGMAVGARRAGLRISEAADLLGFPHITRVHRQRSKKEKISSKQQFSG